MFWELQFWKNIESFQTLLCTREHFCTPHENGTPDTVCVLRNCLSSWKWVLCHTNCVPSIVFVFFSGESLLLHMLWSWRSALHQFLCHTPPHARFAKQCFRHTSLRSHDELSRKKLCNTFIKFPNIIIRLCMHASNKGNGPTFNMLKDGGTSICFQKKERKTEGRRPRSPPGTGK